MPSPKPDRVVYDRNRYNRKWFANVDFDDGTTWSHWQTNFSTKRALLEAVTEGLWPYPDTPVERMT